MYRIDDEKAYIKELQRYLLFISEYDTAFPRVAIDGVFGNETKKAVLYFQKQAELEESGKVDKETFERLYKKYLDAVNKTYALEYIITDNGFPLRYGVQNNDVATLHFLLDELTKTYEYPVQIPTGSFYNHQTERYVKELQKIFGLVESGAVDGLLFERFLREMRLSKLSRRN